MGKSVNKSVLQSGRMRKMSAESIAKPEASSKAHCPQCAAAEGYVAMPTDIEMHAKASADKVEAEAKRRFDAWRAKYEPVAREIYAKRSKRAESRRRRAKARRNAFGDLCEMTEGLASFCRQNNVSLEEGEMMLNQCRRPARHAVLFVLLFEIAWFGAVFLRKELTRLIDRAKHEAMRPYYYEQEKLRRQAMAEERRKIGGRSTRNACPTREEIIDAWKKVKDSNEDLLRFGSLMEDLECYVDNSLVRDDSGAIIGRRSGIKGWLQVEIPALYAVYSRVMAYKAAAKRMRQLVELQDPIPLSSILDFGRTPKSAQPIMQDYGEDEMNDCAKHDGWMCRNDGGESKRIAGNAGKRAKRNGVRRDAGLEARPGGIGEVEEVAVLRARALYLEVIKPVRDGARRQTALIERMVKLTDPDSIEDCNMLETWKAKYELKITVRTKSLWAKRLVKMLA